MLKIKFFGVYTSKVFTCKILNFFYFSSQKYQVPDNVWITWVKCDRPGGRAV